jgi:hypothetical protein
MRTPTVARETLPACGGGRLLGVHFGRYPDVEMAAIDDDSEDTGAQVPWTLRVKDAFWPAPAPKPGVDGQPDRIPEERRKEVMRSLDPQEVKLSFGAFMLATIAGIAIPAYIVGSNRVTKAGKNSISVAPDAWLLAAVILVLSIAGFVALWKRRRTPVVFVLFFVGFAFSLFNPIIFLAFVFLGGWFMLRAWRINRYGTTDAKAIRQEVATRPRGKAAAGASKTSSSTTKGKASQPAARKPPTASKRYTPKSPPRKKIPKPTE